MQMEQTSPNLGKNQQKNSLFMLAIPICAIAFSYWIKSHFDLGLGELILVPSDWFLAFPALLIALIAFLLPGKIRKILFVLSTTLSILSLVLPLWLLLGALE